MHGVEGKKLKKGFGAGSAELGCTALPLLAGSYDGWQLRGPEFFKCRY
jgi:hypothetical protein